MKKKKLSVGRALSTLFPLMFKHVSFLILPYGILTLIVAALSGATVYTNQIFFDSLVETISENRNWEHTIMCALLALLVILLAQILGRINGFLWVYLGDKLELSLIYEYNKKISEIPAVYFEDPIYLQDLEREEKM